MFALCFGVTLAFFVAVFECSFFGLSNFVCRSSELIFCAGAPLKRRDFDAVAIIVEVDRRREHCDVFSWYFVVHLDQVLQRHRRELCSLFRVRVENSQDEVHISHDAEFHRFFEKTLFAFVER